MCIYVCVCVCVCGMCMWYVYVYVHLYLDLYMYVYVCMCMCKYVYVYALLENKNPPFLEVILGNTIPVCLCILCTPHCGYTQFQYVCVFFVHPTVGTHNSSMFVYSLYTPLWKHAIYHFV